MGYLKCIAVIQLVCLHSPLSFLSFSSVQSLQYSIDKAVAYLERRLPGLTYSYAVAMTSYALANENKLNREILYNFISPGVVTQQYSSANIQKQSLYVHTQNITTMGLLEPMTHWYGPMDLYKKCLFLFCFLLAICNH